MTKKPATSLRRADFLIPVIIFTCAFAVRMAFVLQAKESPFWRVPLVDARIYDQAARDLVNTSWLGPLPNDLVQSTPYTQPPLYQTFLALIYSVFGRSVMAAAVIQYLIGSLTCVLVYLIGLRFFDPPEAGIAAGIATALTASQIFYEGRLLPPVLITFLNLTIILLAAKQLGSPAGWRWPAIGLLVGLSAIARPDILLFLPALIVWMWLERKTALPHRPALWTAFMLLAMLLPIGIGRPAKRGRRQGLRADIGQRRDQLLPRQPSRNGEDAGNQAWNRMGKSRVPPADGQRDHETFGMRQVLLQAHVRDDAEVQVGDAPELRAEVPLGVART